MIRRSFRSRPTSLTLLFVVWMAVTLPLAAQDLLPPQTADLDWLTGCWTGDGGEECWLQAEGGMMLGVNRGPGSKSFEFLRIEQAEGGPWIYHASPGGRCPPTAFTSTEIDRKRVVFENPDHDFPQRIEYWLDDSNHLHARVSADRGGESRGFEITWQRGDWSTRD